MFKFFKRDPLDRAKKHVDKALAELEDGYPDYASIEYEKAAQLFIEANHIDFAVKYYREAAYAALDDDDHSRAAEMKMAAARLLLADGLFAEGGGLFAEASDHFNKEKKIKEATNAISVAVIAHLASRSFDTAINLFKKAEKRTSTSRNSRTRLYELASMCVSVLCEGEDVPVAKLDKVLNSVKLGYAEAAVVDYVTSSVRLAMQTEVAIEWAGPEMDSVPAKTPVEFELRYSCPVPVRVTDYRLPLSNSLTFEREPNITTELSTTGSWLMVLKPVLSGDAVVGPFQLTLEGEKVLVNKHSNKIEFRIEPAPPDLEMELSPRRIDCGLGDEVVLDVIIRNVGDGPANNLTVTTELSDGLELSIGGPEKSIQFIGSGETMRFQVYIRGVALGDEVVTVKVASAKGGKELVESSLIRVV